MVVGSYLIGSTHMRVKDDRGSRFMGPNAPHQPDTQTTTNWPARLKERCEMVFQMVPEKMKNLIIVNSNLSSFEKIRACVDAAEKHADKIMVIPALLALLTYALEALAQFHNPPEDEVILVVIITSKFVDYVILRRVDGSLGIDDYRHFGVDECEEIFPEFYDNYFPHSTIFLVHENMVWLAERIRDHNDPENCFFKPFKRWDFVLLFGGMLRADDDDFDTRYHIPNFSSGYDAMVYNYQTRSEERHVILPQRSSFPCDIYGIDCTPQPIKIFYFKEFFQAGNDFVLDKREATSNKLLGSGSSTQILGYIDERGVPYVPPPRASPKSTESPKMDECEDATASRTQESPEIAESENQELHNNANTSSQGFFNVLPPSRIPAASPRTTLPSQPSTSSPINIDVFPLIAAEPPMIKFLFGEKVFGIEVYQDGVTRLLANAAGNEWIPLYLSMAKGTIEIGEKAKIDYSKFPKYVICDILKVIGKPLNEIMIDPKWGFKLIEKNGIVCFQVQTPTGQLQIPQETVVAAFMKSMKLQTQNFLGENIKIKEIRLSTSFRLSTSQKAVFRKAAEKNEMEIGLFSVTDIN